MQGDKVGQPRLLYLDSARGLAALSVMTWHFLVMFIPRENTALIKNPLHLFYYGESDIIFFFIHSGFVLAYSFSHKLTVQYPVSFLQFLVERIFRIFPLFLALLALSFFAQKFVFSFQDQLYITEHAKNLWAQPSDIADAVKQSLLVVLFESQDNKRLLPQDWTLTIELIVGALLPVLIVSIKRSVWLFAVFYLILWQLANTYVFEFGAGVFLFHFRYNISMYWKKINVLGKVALCCMALLFYSCFFQFGSLFSSENIVFSPSLDRFFVNIGCTLFFMIIISSARLQQVLSHQALVKIGKICYSLYLWHMLLLILFAAKLYVFLLQLLRQASIATAIVFCLFIFTTITLSIFSFNYIEVPFNKLGKRVSRQLKHIKITNAMSRMFPRNIN